MPTGSVDDDNDWDAWTPRIVLEYRPHPDLMLWASASRGFKSGGYNSVSIQDPPGFDPEFIWSYEAGVRGSILDERLRFGASAFYYNYRDLQVSRWDALSAGGVATILNAARARGYGVEAEIASRPLRGLELSLDVAYLEAEFTKFSTANPDAPDPDEILDLDGNTLARAPRFSVHASARYTWPVAAFGYATVRSDYGYRTEVFFDPFNADGVRQGGYGLFNVFASLTDAGERWSLSLYGRNLADRTYRQNVARASALIGTLQMWGPPRTFGVEIGLRY